MMRAFSVSPPPPGPGPGEHGRLRGWLQGSLAGICELQLLRERQELRVRRALRLGDAGAESPLEGTEQPDVQTERMWELVQRVEDLRLDAENSCGEMVETDSWQSSGFYEGASPALPSESPASVFGECFSSFPSVAGSYSRIGNPEARIHFANERPKSAGDLGHGEKDGNSGTARIMVPRSFSAPYTSSQDYASDTQPHYQARGSREPFYPSPLHAVTLQNPLTCSSQLRGMGGGHKNISLASYHDDSVGVATDDMDTYGTCPSDFQFFPDPSHCRRLENYMMQLIHRRGQPPRSSKPPRTSLNPEPSRGLARQNSQCKRSLDLRGALCERKYPSQGERNDIPSPGVYENSAGMPSQIWASWDAGADGVSANKSPVTSQASEVFSPPHLSLKKPPKFHANAAHLRATSVDRYQPPASCSLSDGHSFETPLNDTSNSLPQPFIRHSPGGPNMHPPAYEERSGYEPCEKRPPLTAMEEEEGVCEMVNAQYIPAQVTPRLQAAHRNARKKPPPLCKGRSVELSPEHCQAVARERQRGGVALTAAPKKCRFTEEDGEGGKRGGKKGSPRGKKTIRSQSENSLLNKHAALDRTVTKYHTVDREEVAQSKPSRQRRQNAAGYRKWRSTAEICQDEASPSDPYRMSKRSKKVVKGLTQVPVSSSPRNLLYGYAESDSEFSADCSVARPAPVCEPEEDLGGYAAPCYGESGSSLSEGESPAFSTCSSDTDESGGLVWPQQLSPQVVSSTGPGNSSGQPKVFVKIKASHALKKKIMRFRTGSLKVMTTV
uniref:Dapper homolog 3 isoform X1 n=2 Tax=Geotrypetes seraphini TaxID=260995 RepID=A0A6P8S2W7_GEOSA|nr:dapper homolog 3 isoform X1 [Geotrypetes seraphini]